MEEYLGYKNLAPIHKEVEEHLKLAEQTRRGLFLLPRGHLKSTEITVSYVLQRIFREPNIRVLISNAILDNSKGFLREIKGHMEKNERLKALFGEYANTGDEKWSETQIVTSKRRTFYKEPTIQVTSVDKSVVSQHYNLIIADDLENRETVGTKEQREKGKRYYKDLLDLLEPDGTLLVIGTRWHFDDLYGWLLEQNEGNKDFVFMKKRAVDEEGNPIFPQKFSLKYLAQLRQEKGSYEYNAQYNNDPVTEEEADFKREFFKFFRTHETPADGDVYITVDPAISQQDRADFTGIVVNKVVNGVWHIIKGYHVKLNPTQLVDELFYLDSLYKPVEIGIEDMMYTQALEYDVERRMRESGHWFRLTKLKHKGRKKESRIRALIPLFERANIKLSEQTLDLQDELVKFPRAEHDDILDALAYQLDIVKMGNKHSTVQSHATVDIIEPILQVY